MENLQTWLDRLEMVIEPNVVATLDEYCQLLWARNEQLNLTRHTTYEQFVARDLVDSLELSKLLRPGESVLDVGSGGGVPGLVLAILRSDLSLTLTDSVKKKSRVLQEMADSLKVHVEVYDCRAESLLEDFRYDATIARAVGPIVKMIPWFRGQWTSLGRLLLIKGPKWEDELAAARSAGIWPEREVDVTVAAEYPIPGESWRSFILEIRSRKS
jgi:16S rRNA (guanine527-N7)-methyltransferase